MSRDAAATAELDAIRGSGFFDADWYLAEHPDVGLLGMDPAEHYLRVGGRLGRSPSPRFDAAAYLAANPDAAAEGANPLLHFLRHGGRAGEPWSGAALVRRLATARDAAVPGDSDVADAIRPHFDLEFYLTRHADLARAPRIDPVRHYVTNGVREGRDPTPDFSGRSYLRRYPDVAESGENPFRHWLARGRAEGRIGAPFARFEGLCAILGRTPAEVEAELIARRRDLRARLERGVLGEMVAKAAALDPLIALSWTEAPAARIPPFHSDAAVSQVVATARLHAAAGRRRARAVVAIPHCRLSGATRIAGHLAAALAEIHGPDEVLVLRTDLSVMAFPDWFPEGCRHVDLAAEAESLRPDQRRKLLVELIRALRPEEVFNVNSRLMWDAMAGHGRPLADAARLYAYFFCNDKDMWGRWTGYPLQKFYRFFDLLSGVVADSHALADELRERHAVLPRDAGRIAVLETPAPPVEPAPRPAPRPGRRPQVFWAGRFDRQKRVDLVFALARRMPEADFRLWGEPVLDQGEKLPDPPANVALEGVYASLDDLPLGECDVWLYTAEWDGVPNMLIEIAALAVPLVGSLAGGTGEILDPELSRPVAVEDLDGYETGLRAAIADPEGARRRALALRERVLARRAPAAYRAALERLLALGGRP